MKSFIFIVKQLVVYHILFIFCQTIYPIIGSSDTIEAFRGLGTRFVVERAFAMLSRAMSCDARRCCGMRLV
jgi:hypothetical protein